MSGAKEQHNTYIFSLVLTHARYLEKLIPLLALNNISGPFKFVYSTFNDQILETEIFENLREPTFSANQACTTLKLDQNTKKYFEELNINIYLKANKCNLEIENDYQDSINIAKASIHVLDIIGNGNYEKGFEITGEFQLNLLPILYQNEEYELLPKIGLLIKFLPCDSQFLPDINLTKGLKNMEKTLITPNQKSILLDENLAIKMERKKKKEAYKELLVNLMKECITKKDAPSDEENNIFDKYKAEIKQQNLKIQDMENKILDLEKDLQNKSLENINLSQKCTQLSHKLEINSSMLLEYKYNSYKNMLLNYFKENMVEDEKKKHLEVFLSDFWNNLSNTKISSKTTTGPINKEKPNIINNLIESGIFEPEDNFIHYLQGQHNAS